MAIVLPYRLHSSYKTPMKDKPRLKILLANPRGFCAGVSRAIQMVELALKKYGAPVYVRHEIVHNRFVVDSLKEKGAVFVEELSEIPEEGRPVIFSAHGVPKSVIDEAGSRGMDFIDAACPLVSKVHREVERHHAEGRKVILIGHRGHPEVIGTMGQVPEGSVVLIETLEDVRRLDFARDERLAWCSQTTLSVDDTGKIISALEEKFPDIAGPVKEDICYATTNRQEAIRTVAPMADMLVVIGAPNSSNSVRLVEVAKAGGCPEAMLLQRAEDMNWEDIKGKNTLAISAGASAPEALVDEAVESARRYFEVEVEEILTREENTVFQLPRALREV